MILSALMYVCIQTADGNRECDVRASRRVDVVSEDSCTKQLNTAVVELVKHTLKEEGGTVITKTYVKCMRIGDYTASLREVPVTLESLGYSTVVLSFF
ncbi:hypothetical protein HWB52_gp37 [Pseudomonas phage Littlefix]|uniref:Uncharacterized protein n=1 Tax=Pseudomonas phage Littlefix TaxID=2079289 RepID=A0A2K9VHU2_9CAUD|nr:hypothetical protein HWB52_gp37 [Pseudomonas phage Littlefix]AUV61852.1 hypothetical protein PsPhLittlefix_gp37 [Pseudomonas phage Littlefix]